MISKLLSSLFTIAFLFSISVCAQVYLPPPPPVVDVNKMIVNNYLLNQIRINAVGNSMINDNMSNAGGKTKPGAKNNAQSNAASKTVYAAKLGFKYSGYSLLAEKITQNAQPKLSAADAQKLNEFFNALWGNYETSFKEENQRLGTPYNDLASALVFYILNNYMLLHDLSGRSEKSVAVYAQLAPVLLNNPEIAKLNEKDKELLAEVFVSIGAMPSIVLQTTRDAQQAKKLARQNLERIFGSNAAKVKITEKGVEM